MQHIKILFSGFILLCTLFLFSCKKEKNNSPDGGGGVTDIDGNHYDTMRMGTRVWMTENLKTTKYNDGTSIPTGLSDDAWRTTKTGAYSIYDNNAANDATYGKLYNWYAVNSGKLAPKGWHVATIDEWNDLFRYLGGNGRVIGGKMKATTGWNSPNTGADNSSGFSALPGGFRSWAGRYNLMGTNAYFWTLEEYLPPSDYAWYIALFHDQAEIYSSSEYKMQGMSVRCVKD